MVFTLGVGWKFWVAENRPADFRFETHAFDTSGMNHLLHLGFFASTCTAVACSRIAPTYSPERSAQTDLVQRADGASDESLNRSLDLMRSSMTKEEIALFTDALVRIESRTSVAALRDPPGDVEAVNRALREEVHGKSVAEILAAGASR
ncbi:MAG: hypothetical protein SGI72_15685 [Planctomycetota bacterium]|nr:hypothetical protein [Planctomycetota bacterium]